VSIWFHNARPVNEKWLLSGFQMVLESALQIPNKVTTRPEESLFSAETDMCLEYAEVLYEGDTMRFLMLVRLFLAANNLSTSAFTSYICSSVFADCE
jgi:hypothetical protein